MSDDYDWEEPLWYTTKGKRVGIPHSLIQGRIIPRVGTNAFAIYALLMWHKNDATGECYPRMSTLMSYSGLKAKAVRAALTRLVDAGLVSITKRRPRRKNGTEYGYRRICYEL